MRKRLPLVLLVIACSSLQLLAQVYLEGNAALVGAGILNQNNYGFSEMEYDYGLSGAFGVEVGYAVNSKHHFQLGLTAVQLGQNYEDELFQLVDVLHRKEVDLNYLMIPLRYKIVLGDTREQVFGTRAFFSAGLYYARLRSADISWFLGGQEVNFVTFHESQERNDNIQYIKDNLLKAGRNDPADDTDLFEARDFGVLGSWGVRFFLGSPLALNLELMGGYGFGEINAEPWRLNNDSGVYEPSNNAFAAFRVSLGYYFGLQGTGN